MYGKTLVDPRTKAGVDTFNFNGGNYIITGNVAARLLAANMDPNVLRTNDTLRKDEWIDLDNAVIKIARERLVVVQDLIGLGLVKTLKNGLGSTILQWQTSSDFTAAEVSMDGITRIAGDRIDYELAGIPLPIIHKDFQINARFLNVARSSGDGIDTDQAERAARVMSEKVEDIFINGLSTYKFGGYNLYGLTNFTSRNTGSLTAAWSSSSTTGLVMYNDMMSMVDDLESAHYYGPYGVWVPATYHTALMRDYKTYGTITIHKRLMETGRFKFIRPADKLAAGNVVMAQLTSDVIQIVIGMQPTNVQWQTDGGLLNHFKTMCIMIPRLRADQDGNCGIAHYSV